MLNIIYCCRLLKYALDLKKPVMLLNVGPSRADGIPGVEKVDLASGTVLREVARAVMCRSSSSTRHKSANLGTILISGTRAKDDPIVVEMLRSGIIKPPAQDE